MKKITTIVLYNLSELSDKTNHKMMNWFVRIFCFSVLPSNHGYMVPEQYFDYRHYFHWLSQESLLFSYFERTYVSTFSYPPPYSQAKGIESLPQTRIFKSQFL